MEIFIKIKTAMESWLYEKIKTIEKTKLLEISV